MFWKKKIKPVKYNLRLYNGEFDRDPTYQLEIRGDDRELSILEEELHLQNGIVGEYVVKRINRFIHVNYLERTEAPKGFEQRVMVHAYKIPKK